MENYCEIFNYVNPDDYNLTIDGNLNLYFRLSCAEGLVFSQEKETCQRCQDVRRSDGTTCC